MDPQPRTNAFQRNDSTPLSERDDDASLFHLIVSNADMTHILVQFEDGMARFPSVLTRDHVPSWGSHPNYALAEIQSHYKVDLYLRRALWRRTLCDGSAVKREESLVVVDVIPNDLIDEGSLAESFSAVSPARWLTQQEALSCSWALVHKSLDITAALDTFFAEETGRIALPAQRQVWRTRGWYAEIVRLVDRVLSDNRLQRVGRLQQERNSSHCTVLWCWVCPSSPENAAKRIVYVKCSSSYFNEAAVTVSVSRLLPFITPAVMSSTDDTFLQWDAENRGLPPSDSAFLRTLARMQLQSLAHLDELRKTIPVRDRDWCLAKIERLFSSDSVAIRIVGQERFSALVELRGELMSVCDALEQSKIPLTLVHRDLDCGNVFCFDLDSKEPKVRFIDWASCCIAHPFLDYARIINGFFDAVRDEEEKQRYLSEWLPYNDMASIKAAAKCARPLMMLHALIEMCELRENIVEPVEREELDGAISYGFESIVEAIVKAIDELNTSGGAKSG